MIHIYIISFTSQTNLSRRQDKGFLIKFMIKCFSIIEIESKNIGIDSNVRWASIFGTLFLINSSRTLLPTELRQSGLRLKRSDMLHR